MKLKMKPVICLFSTAAVLAGSPVCAQEPETDAVVQVETEAVKERADPETEQPEQQAQDPDNTEPETNIPETVTEETSQSEESAAETTSEAWTETKVPTEKGSKHTSSGQKIVKNWSWKDTEEVVEDDHVDVLQKGNKYALTYQNFKSCLPEEILSDTAETIKITDWNCKEADIEDGQELFSMKLDSIHLLAVLDNGITADPKPQLTVRFLTLEPAGRFTGEERGIWRFVVHNKEYLEKGKDEKNEELF